MAKPGRKRLRPGHVTRLTAFYTTAEDRRRMERHAGDVPVSAWLRRLVAAELARLDAREQLQQA